MDDQNQLTKAFIQSEMLAESAVGLVADIKALLETGQVDQCLSKLAELEHDMRVTLAFGERIDLRIVN